MKVLVVNLESNEAVVLQVKVDPKKLNDFIEKPAAGHHRDRPAPREETAPQSRETSSWPLQASQSWDGICLFLQDDPQTATQPQVLDFPAWFFKLDCGMFLRGFGQGDHQVFQVAMRGEIADHHHPDHGLAVDQRG